MPVAWPAHWADVYKTLSDRMTPARVRAAVGDVEFVDAAAALTLWAADLVLAVVPDYPEGAVAAARWARPAVEAATAAESRVVTLALVDGWLVGASGVRGGFDLADARPRPGWVSTPDNWLSARYYNLRRLFADRGGELERVCLIGKPQRPGPTPGPTPPPSSSCS